MECVRKIVKRFLQIGVVPVDLQEVLPVHLTLMK